jgi:transposase
MQNKRRWLPRWQRIELVQLCLEQGWTRREAAAWRRVSVSTVQFWVQRYRQASEADRASGVWADERPSLRLPLNHRGAMVLRMLADADLAAVAELMRDIAPACCSH